MPLRSASSTRLRAAVTSLSHASSTTGRLNFFWPTVSTFVPTHHKNALPRLSWMNVVLRPVFLLCAALGIVLLGGLATVIFVGATGSFSQTSGPTLDLPTLAGRTFVTSAIALSIATPIGLLGALYLTEFAHGHVLDRLEPMLRFLARIPPIVYGYFAISTLLPALVHLVPSLDDHPLWAAGIALGGMIAPRFLELARAAVATVPQHLRDAASALGAGAFSTVRFVVLPAARKRLLAAFAVSASRAVGETMIVLTVFVDHASRQTSRPDSLTTFLVPEGGGVWANQVPKEFFVVGCALLILSLVLGAARPTLDEPTGQGGAP